MPFHFAAPSQYKSKSSTSLRYFELYRLDCSDYYSYCQRWDTKLNSIYMYIATDNCLSPSQNLSLTQYLKQRRTVSLYRGYSRSTPAKSDTGIWYCSLVYISRLSQVDLWLNSYVASLMCHLVYSELFVQNAVIAKTSQTITKMCGQLAMGVHATSKVFLSYIDYKSVSSLIGRGQI